MIRLKTLIAWAISVAPSYASQPDIGWKATIVTENVTFNTDYVGGGERRLFIDAPIAITRFEGTADSVTLNIYSSPYFAPNTSDSQSPSSNQTLVHTATIQPPQSQEEYSQTLSFDMLASPWQDVVLALSLNEGGIDHFRTEWSGAVIVYNATTDSWSAWNTGKYANVVNAAVTRQLDSFVPGGQNEGQDKHPDRVYVFRPVNKIVPKPSSNDSTSESTPTQSNTYTTATEIMHTTVSPDYGTITTQSSEAPHPTISVCDCDPVIIYSTITVYPDSSKSAASGKTYHARQEKERLPAFVDAKLTFQDRDDIPRPLRFIRITAQADLFEGDVKVGSWASIETMDENGIALFQFGISPGQRIVVHTLFAQLEGEHYLIGTRAKEEDQFDVVRLSLDISLNPWMVAAGDTISVGPTFPLSENYKALWVADAYHTITEFFSSKIATRAGEMEKVNVWFPAPSSGAFFSVGGPVPYISLPASQAQNPTVMGHEYGHFAHYLARRKEFFDGGGTHYFCYAFDVKISTSFEEGYATALGLLSLDGTHLVGDDYMVYEDRATDGPPYRQPIEDFSCFQRNMTNQEGRIAAALIDLVDRKLDTFHSTTDDFGFIAPDFDPQLLNWCFEPRFIFWRALYNNPSSIVEYWRQLQAVMNSSSEKIAWAILQYNFADFPSQL